MKKLALCFLFLLSNNLYAAVSDADISKSAYCTATSYIDEYSNKPILDVGEKRIFPIETVKLKGEYCYRIQVPKGKNASIELLAKPGLYFFAIGKLGQAPKLFTSKDDDPNLCFVQAENIYSGEPLEHVQAYSCDQILKGQQSKSTIYYAAFQYVGGRVNPDCEHKQCSDKEVTKRFSDGNQFRATILGETNFSQ